MQDYKPEINIQSNTLLSHLYLKRNNWDQIERDCNMDLFEKIQKVWHLLLVICFGPIGDSLPFQGQYFCAKKSEQLPSQTQDEKREKKKGKRRESHSK